MRAIILGGGGLTGRRLPAVLGRVLPQGNFSNAGASSVLTGWLPPEGDARAAASGLV